MFSFPNRARSIPASEMAGSVVDLQVLLQSECPNEVAEKLIGVAHPWEGTPFNRLRKNPPVRQIVATAAKSRHWFRMAFAALKGRSSTVLHAFASFSALRHGWKCSAPQLRGIRPAL